MIALTVTTPSLESMNAGRPTQRSKVGETLDREIDKPGENLGQVVAHWDFNRGSFPPSRGSWNFRSRLRGPEETLLRYS